MTSDQQLEQEADSAAVNNRWTCPSGEMIVWTDLLDGSPRRSAAIAALDDLAVRVASRELARRAASSDLSAYDRNELARDAATDAVLAILRKIDQFRGESKFTTWAYKFVILEVSSHLGRHYRRNAPALLPEPEAWGQFVDRMGMDPVHDLQAAELAASLRRAVEDLSEKQQQVFVEVVVQGVPADAVADRLKTNRNAIYKVIFDARRRIRSALIVEGLMSAEGVASE
ncbi:RNA polymerase sigma factor [Rudaeicoccus suwonensis]|uniref:RNA polymerase sigma-70 factor (ECF subfamily) n=1 Tax=Rudaeicoccus suwonensis TaxID=657409 RepID=A0A561E3U1_9MICO|nr:sigma-70 family RNA polymerase sigma factor [Rudaeicoccus suwonensis]TWE10283.1 RNA polymerase sigma-70 factor (ECF subfamily) [Rudaeicoccus suwonensis]